MNGNRRARGRVIFGIFSTMRKLLLMCCWLANKNSSGQDSLAAVYTNTLIERIESHLDRDGKKQEDTILYEPTDTSRAGLILHTEYYMNRAGQIEKIIENSKYKNLVTEIVVYYVAEQPVRFSSMQKEDNRVLMDFDIYFRDKSLIYSVNRNGNKQPDPAVFFRWCLELLQGGKQEKSP